MASNEDPPPMVASASPPQFRPPVQSPVLPQPDAPGRPIRPPRSSRQPTPGRGGSAIVDRGAPPPPRLAALIAEHRTQPGGLLPLLHAVQAEFGQIAAAMVPAIADGLGLSRAEVHGVIRYYSHFRQLPRARHAIEICAAEACLACGGDSLLEKLVERLGCAPDTIRDDGAVSVERIYCFGLCAVAPAVRVDGGLHGRVTGADLDRLLDGLGSADARDRAAAPMPADGAEGQGRSGPQGGSGRQGRFPPGAAPGPGREG